MPVTVLYISQGLRTKGLKPFALAAIETFGCDCHMAWLQRGKCECLCALQEAEEPSCGRGGGYRQVFIPLCIKLLSTGGGILGEEWLCRDVGDLLSACPCLFPRFL